jgi:hypothetical protein
MKRSILTIAAALLVCCAATAQPLRVRGTIAAVTPASLTVTSRDGATLEIALIAPLRVSTVKPMTLADIKPGSYIGTAAVPCKNGVLEAQEVLVFPATLRGAGEGHRPWDLTPGSTMTNADVEARSPPATARS